MSIPADLPLSITPAAAQALTPAQKKFNTLTRKLQKQRQLLLDWQHNIDMYRLRYDQELRLKIDAHDQEQFLLVRFLDQRAQQPNAPAPDALRDFTRILADRCIDEMEDEEHIKELKTIYDRNSDTTYAEQQAFVRESTQAAVENEYGVDLGDLTGVNSIEDFLARMQDPEMMAKILGKMGGGTEPKKPAKPRKPTAAQQRKAAAEQQASQSMREVFRQLASALHPDREPDAQERERKTALMQRVNQAYANQDLLTLLSLQLELEHIDQDSINTLAQDRIQHYNRVLSKQSEEIADELRGLQFNFCMEFQIEPFGGLRPQDLGEIMDSNTQKYEQRVQQIQQLRVTLGKDKNLAQWVLRELKSYNDFFAQ